MHYLLPFPDWDKTGRGESSAPSWCFARAQHFASLSNYTTLLALAPHVGALPLLRSRR